MNDASDDRSRACRAQRHASARSAAWVRIDPQRVVIPAHARIVERHLTTLLNRPAVRRDDLTDAPVGQCLSSA